MSASPPLPFLFSGLVIDPLLLKDLRACPGPDCDCRACTIRSIGTGEAQDASWLRYHQSKFQPEYDFRVYSARLAMLKNGIYLPKKFDPSLLGRFGEGCAPEDLFEERQCVFSNFPQFNPHRFFLKVLRPVGPEIPAKMQMIFTDGACSGNGTASSKAGIGFAFSQIGREKTRGCVSIPLELEVRDGKRYTQTSNRAELRAVIAALEWRRWYREGWDALVIATDSTYVTNGATTWVSAWVEREWCKANGDKAANRDLWKYLLRLFREYAIHGCEIMIWQIPRAQNQLADEMAKKAIERFETPTEWKTWRDPMLKIDTDFDF